MLRKLKLYGELAKFIGHKEFEIKVSNLPQAISFLRNNFPEVESYMNPKYYQVKIGDYEINKNELNFPIGKQDIHIIPVISGAGGDSFNQILLGGLLIGASFFFPGAGLFGTQSFSGVLAAGSQSAIPFVGATGVSGGLLGTVIGMIETFQAITVFGTGDPKQMAGGISQALVTTMLGLIFAAPLLAMYTLLSEKVSGILQEIEEFVAVNIVKKIQ